MKRLLLVAALPFCGLTTAIADHVILCGGPALLQWESLRIHDEQHDNFWGNFIRASTIRLDELRKVYGPEARFSWLVYKPGYVTRGRENGKTLVKWIEQNAAKRNCALTWISSGSEAIDALNRMPSGSVTTFDYFGHSNKHCFMLDYGNEIQAVSKAWIHENDLGRIRRRIFARNALCQSWGCYTGLSMNAVWHQKLGTRLISAAGKTDYEVVGAGRLPIADGPWIR